MSTPDQQIGPRMIIDHSLDEERSVYCLVVAREIFIPAHSIEVVEMDGEGQPIFDEVSLLDAEGEPLYDEMPPMEEGGEPISMPRMKKVPRLTTQEIERSHVGFTEVVDFVFEASDPCWFDDGVRKSDSDVAQLQKEIVKQAIEGESAAQVEVEAPRKMPGIGEEL